MELGKKIWVFADGDLPPQGNEEPLGHEALMVVNNSEQDAEMTIDLLFEDKEPVENLHLRVPAKRVNCFRMDFPVGDEQFEIPKGQFAVILKSDVPVVAQYGRAEPRAVAFYTTPGYCE